jgi:acyl-CoA thioesterase I
MASSSDVPGSLPAGPQPTTLRLRYVALGDSYTIGTSVRARDRWTNQLVRALNPQIDLDLIANLAENGATTGDVIEDQLPQLARLAPDFISLLVGVNDVVDKVDPEVYRERLDTILDGLLKRVSPQRLLLVTTPDYTLTPKGADYGDPVRQAPRVAEFNKVLETEATERGIPYADITPVANLVSDDPSLVASDGLHPSAKQYAGWVELIAPKVRQMLHSTATYP